MSDKAKGIRIDELPLWAQKPVLELLNRAIVAEGEAARLAEIIQTMTASCSGICGASSIVRKGMGNHG